jgi:HD-GYP domain-containing protein (c-di-GMP phosphodiesterase class II)
VATAAHSTIQKVATTDLKVGMFVADLDRPWVETPFLLQGFVIESDKQILELRKCCKFVVIDRARSTGNEFVAPPKIDVQGAQRKPVPQRVTATEVRPANPGAVNIPTPPPQPTVRRTSAAPRALKFEEMSARAKAYDAGTPESVEEAEGSGLLDRVVGFFKFKPRRIEPPVKPEPPRESPADFQARTSLLPPGIAPQTYLDEVSVEQEVPRARAVVAQSSDLLDRLVKDIESGRTFEVERVEEIVKDMVESIVRNPDALMWVARLREQDATTYGHGLQVSVYLTSFGRHLGFPKEHLGTLAQIGLLLDIGKIRVPKEVLSKQGKLEADEFMLAKEHVTHSLSILAETPNFDPQVIEAIAQHHERLNGSGYPLGLEGDEISIYGAMAGIADCFSALIKNRPYAEAVSSYEALRSLTSWGGELFQEALVQQFVSSVGVFPVGSLIELSTGEVAIVVAHNKVRRLKPRVLIVTGPDKTPAAHPTMVDLLYDPKLGGDEPAYIKRGLPAGAYGLDLRDFYLA